MTKEELAVVLANHSLWLSDSNTGSRANLTGANLTGANLTRANLTEANLTRANLTEAILTGADFTRAVLIGADFTRAITGGCVLSFTGIGSRNDTLICVRHSDGSITCQTGCFRGTLDELLSAVQKTHGDNLHAIEYRTAVQMAKTIYAARFGVTVTNNEE